MVLCSLAFASELNEANVASVGEPIRDCGLRISARTGGVVPIPDSPHPASSKGFPARGPALTALVPGLFTLRDIAKSCWNVH